MKLAVFLALAIIFLSNMSASCNEGQIDINTATLEELDKLYGIGPAKAQNIINSRPFSSVDELINVYGIGNATLNGIKSQGLACVGEIKKESHEEDEKEDDNETGNQAIFNTNITNNLNSEINPTPADNRQNFETEPIKLNYQPNNTKDIKSEENSENLNKENKIAMYGFFVFSVLIGILLIIRRKKIYKNDFE